MFDWIKDFLAATGTLLSPVVITRPWQGVVISRYGRGHRDKGPGYYWKWPFFEDCHHYECCETTMRLPPQSLLTADGKPVVISSMVKYEIKDGKKYICDVWDAKDVLADVSMGAIAQHVQKHSYAELMQGEPEKKVLTAVKYGTNKYGFQVNAITFTDKSPARSLRLVMPHAKDLDN